MLNCIVTQLFDNYGIIHEPELPNEFINFDWYVFTDNKDLKSKHWNVIYLPEFDTDKLTGIQKTYIFKYTFYKYIPHIERYNYIIQLDASIKIYQSLYPIIEYMKRYEYDLSISLHPERNNVFDEYDAWIQLRNLDPTYKEIFQNFISDDFKNIDGLCECSFKIYKNCKEIYNFLDDIHNIMSLAMNNQDANDQCYFTYILYHYLDKLRINYHSPNLYNNSKYMILFEHNTNLKRYDGQLFYLNYKLFLNKIIKITNDDEY